MKVVDVRTTRARRARRAAPRSWRDRVTGLLPRSQPAARRALTSEPDRATPARGARPRAARVALSATVTVAAFAAGVVGLAGAAPVAGPEPSPTVASTAANPPGTRGDRPDRDVDRPSLPPSTPPSGVPSAGTRTPSMPPTGPSSPSAQPLERIKAHGTRWTTATLDLRLTPAENAEVDGTVAPGTKVSITRTSGAYTGVLRDGLEYWVTSKYLAKSAPPGTGPVSLAPCSSGSAVENGLTPDAVRVHRAICNEFPSFTRFGGVRADPYPDHPSGRAVDAMLPGGAGNNALGWTVARWLQAHASELGIEYIQFDQHIWSVERSGEGWRLQSDRGGTTANHRDHVHITVFGSSGRG